MVFFETGITPRSATHGPSSAAAPQPPSTPSAPSSCSKRRLPWRRACRVGQMPSTASWSPTNARGRQGDPLPTGELGSYFSAAHTACPPRSFKAWGAAVIASGLLTKPNMDQITGRGHWNAAPNNVMVDTLNATLTKGTTIVVTGAAAGAGLAQLRPEFQVNLFGAGSALSVSFVLFVHKK